MKPFEQALLDAVCEEYEQVPMEEELCLPELNFSYRRKQSTIRRCLLIASICIVLAGSAIASYAVNHRIGKVKIETEFTEIFNYLTEEDEDGNQYHRITFEENFCNPCAPDRIERFYLPEVPLEKAKLSLSQWYVEKTDYGTFYPYMREQYDFNPTKPEDYKRILAEPTTVHYSWSDHSQFGISFMQSTAKEATDGTPYLTFAFEESEEVSSYTETIELDGYSIFTFNIDFSKKDLGENHFEKVSRTWIWTDGDYVYQLNANLGLEDMTDLFRSVRPVSKTYPYTTEGKDIYSIQEKFDMVKDHTE